MVLGKKILIALGVIVALLAGCVAWWVASAYQPDAAALAAVADEDGLADGVTVWKLSDGSIVFEATDPVAGMVFYPGAKVEPEAYAVLLTRLAREGVTCVLADPPLNFALLDIDAAEGVAAEFPEIDTWLLGGHSLGGVAASEYLAKHGDEFDGIVYLASYPNCDLSGYEGMAVQITGDDDGVVNRERLDESDEYLPDDLVEITIEGGNHAQFGNYGEQAGDGTATISSEEQQEQTVDAILDALEAV